MKHKTKHNPSNPCTDCNFYIQQSYDFNLLPDGMCVHWAFHKAGLAYFHIDTDLNAKINPLLTSEMEIKWRNQRDRPDAKEVLELQQNGWHWLDTIDIKQHFRTCSHFVSRSTNARYIGDWYKGTDEIDYDEILETLKPLMEPQYHEWLTNNGASHEYIDLVPYKSFHLRGDRGIKTTPFDVLPKKHGLCITCKFFNPVFNEFGAIKPYLGTCKKTGFSSGLFQDDSNKSNYVFNFLSCAEYKIKEIFKSSLAQATTSNTSIPMKLIPFVETNNPNLTMADLIKFSHYPNVMRQICVPQEVYEKKLLLDFAKLNKSKEKLVDRKAFNEFIGATPQVKFFRKTVVTETKKNTEFYKKFEAYDNVNIFNNKEV